MTDDGPGLYLVRIAHRRRGPVSHAFRYRSYMWAFDLDRPPVLPAPLGGLARWRPEDHADVRAELGRRGITAERITVLASLRVGGYVFNPLSVYWCFDRAGRLVAHVAEVHNTYGGRHVYVLPTDDPGNRHVPKAMYVSPFHPVDGHYSIRISEPGPTVRVAVRLSRPGTPPFTATLAGRRVEPSLPALMLALARYPLAPLRARALIQYQGLRLWAKGLEVQPR